MKTQNLSTLRNELFDVIQRLKDGNDPNCDPQDTIDIERAMAINDVAKSIIDTAKVEVSALKIISGYDDKAASDFVNQNSVLQLKAN